MAQTSDLLVQTCDSHKFGPKLVNVVKVTSLDPNLWPFLIIPNYGDEAKSCIQKYLVSPEFTATEKSLLLKLRTRMVDVRENFKNKYLNNDYVSTHLLK